MLPAPPQGWPAPVDDPKAHFIRAFMSSRPGKRRSDPGTIRRVDLLQQVLEAQRFLRTEIPQEISLWDHYENVCAYLPGP